MTSFILDTDIGTDVDDALALAYLIAQPEVDLIGVTTVHANAPLRASIARRLLEVAGKTTVPVIAGHSEPIRRSAVPDFHWNELWGHEGRGLLSTEEISAARSDKVNASLDPDAAAQFIIDSATAKPGEIRLITVGPLTNLARALQLEPNLAESLGPVTMMGGLVDRRGTTWAPQFETNLNADPGAAEIVLGSNLDITLVPLEVTLQAYLTRADLAALKESGTPVAASLLRLIAEMREPFLAFSERYSLDGSEFDERVYMHDPLAVHVALGKAGASVRRAPIAVGWENQALTTVEVSGTGQVVGICEHVDSTAFVAEWVRAVEKI